MAAASLDVNFKEELNAIEQCESLDTLSSRSDDLARSLSSGFKVHSKAKRTAALCSLVTFYSGANPLLHHRPATNGYGRPHDCPHEPGCRGFYAKPDGS